MMRAKIELKAPAPKSRVGADRKPDNPKHAKPKPRLYRRGSGNATINKTVAVPVQTVRVLLREYRDWAQRMSIEPQQFKRLRKAISEQHRTAPLGVNLNEWEHARVLEFASHYEAPQSKTGAKYTMGQATFNAVACWCIAEGAEKITGELLASMYPRFKPSLSLVINTALNVGLAMFPAHHKPKETNLPPLPVAAASATV